MSGYPGCRQPEETVVLGGLLWDYRLANCIKQLAGPDYRTEFYNHNPADPNM